MRSVVTGGGGFLGRHIVEALLSRGDEVVTVARGHYPDLQRPGVTQVAANVGDRNALVQAFQGAQQVFHVAARVGIWGPWPSYLATNVHGTENVLHAARANGIAKLVYTSSPSVVFDGTSQRGIDERAPYPEHWLSPYPRSKQMAEQAVLKANGRDGLYTVALRPHLIWGRGDKFLIPRVVDQARQGKLMRVGDGKNLVDIIQVRNAALAHLQAADRLGAGSPCAGKAYFLSQGEPVVLWDFIGNILERAGLPPLRKSISFSTAYRVGGLLEGIHRMAAPEKEPRMTRFLAHQLAKDHYYDIRAARRELDYEPVVSTAAGLDELF